MEKRTVFGYCLYSEDTIKLVEWSENAGNLIPDIRWTVHISFDADNENDRVIVINHIGEETPQYPSLEATV
jgi:tRNA A37 threonylcarbamoyladenosine biosynthesis protein TsaE